jgi:hypothetical protein
MTAYSFDSVNTIANDLPSGTITQVALFEVDTALVAADTIGSDTGGILMPVGAVINDVTIIYPELDSSGSATLSVGDSDDANRFIAAAPMSGSATYYRTDINVIPTSTSGVIGSGMGYKYTAEKGIFITIDATAVGTGVTGAAPIVLKVQYTLSAD